MKDPLRKLIEAEPWLLEIDNDSPVIAGRMERVPRHVPRLKRSERRKLRKKAPPTD